MKRYLEERDRYDHYEGEDSDYGISENDYNSLLDKYNDYMDEDAENYESRRNDIHFSNKVCDECGHPLDDDEMECPNCGAHVEGAEPKMDDFYEYDNLFDDCLDDYHANDIYESKRFNETDTSIKHIGYDDELPTDDYYHSEDDYEPLKPHIQKTLDAFKKELKKNGFSLKDFDITTDEQGILCTIKNYSIFDKSSRDVSDEDIDDLSRICKKLSKDESDEYHDWDGSSIVDFGNSVFVDLYDEKGNIIYSINM